MSTLFFDLETTGLLLPVLAPRTKQPRIIEICLYTPNERDSARDLELHTYCDPDVRIPYEVTKHTGITGKDLEGAPPFAQIARHVKTFIETCDLAVAHNAPFDQEVLDHEMDRLGMVIKWPRLMCTVEMSQHLKGYRLGLKDLVAFCELDGNEYGYHGAREDVRAMKDCYNWLKENGEL